MYKSGLKRIPHQLIAHIVVKPLLFMQDYYLDKIQ